MKTAFSNFVRCIKCGRNILESRSEVVKSIEDIDGFQVELNLNMNLNLKNRRFEKFHQCNKDCFDDNNNATNGQLIEFDLIQTVKKLVFHPVYEGVEIVTIPEGNNLLDDNQVVQEDNLSNNSHDSGSPQINPERALDAMLELLSEDEDNEEVQETSTSRNTGSGSSQRQDTEQAPDQTDVEDVDNNPSRNISQSANWNETESQMVRGRDPVDSQTEDDLDDKYITIMFPVSDKVSKLIHVKNSYDSKKIENLLYSGNKFDQNVLSELYLIQSKKYLSSSNLYSGTVLDQAERTVRIDQFSNESKIRGSEKYNMKMSDDMEARFDTNGNFCLRVLLEIPLNNEETVATCLLQENIVVTVSMEGDSGNLLERKYYVHSHKSNLNCREGCVKVDLETYLEAEDNFDKKNLRNKYLPTYVLSCARKLEEFVQCLVKCPKSDFFSSEFFFQLVFKIDSTICIEGLMWPECFKFINLALASESYTGQLDKDVERQFLIKLEESLFCSSDLDSISSNLNISQLKAQKIKSKIRKNQVHIENSCSSCSDIKLPSLAMILTKPLDTVGNGYSIKRFMEIFKNLLKDLGDYGKKTLSTFEWLNFIWEERIRDVSVENNIFSMVIEEEKIDFIMDTYFLELMNKWPELFLLAPYHYCLSFSIAGRREIIFKRKKISDCFTHFYCEAFLNVTDSTLVIDPIFGYDQWMWTKEKDSDGGATYFLRDHKEISLAEAISLVDPIKFRGLSSSAVDYVHTLPGSKLFFKKVSTETDVTFKDNDGFYEQNESSVSRFFKRLNGVNLILCEFLCWYEYAGSQKSSELFPVYHHKLSQIEDSDVLTLNEKELLPTIILCENGDVLQKRKSQKIIRCPLTHYLSDEYKFSKCLLFSRLSSYEELTLDSADTLFEKCVDPTKPMDSVTNPRIVEFNERYCVLRIICLVFIFIFEFQENVSL